MQNHRPNIIVLGMHKAASTFIADQLLPTIARRTADYRLYNVGSALIRFRESETERLGRTPDWVDESHHDRLMRCFGANPPGQSNTLIGRVYPGHLSTLEQFFGGPIPSESNRLVVVRRDPRDALISLYYSLRVSHNPERIEGNTESFLKSRQSLQSRDVADGVRALLASTEEEMVHCEFLTCTDRILQNANVADLPYELLINQPREWLNRFVEFGELGNYVDDAWYESMVNHLTPPETEDPQSHKRRMRPGNWREVFDSSLSELLAPALVERMIQFGYSWESTAPCPVRERRGAPSRHAA